MKNINKILEPTCPDIMKEDLEESIRIFMKENDINENITLKNTSTLFRTFERYNKLKEFKKIPKLIESKELKMEMDNMINRI